MRAKASCIGGNLVASRKASLQSYQPVGVNGAYSLYLLIVLLKGVYRERRGFSGWYRDFATIASETCELRLFESHIISQTLTEH